MLAQIGVTVAGFASLAAVVGQTLSTAHPEVNSIRLRGLVAVVFQSSIGRTGITVFRVMRSASSTMT